MVKCKKKTSQMVFEETHTHTHTEKRNAYENIPPTKRHTTTTPTYIF